MNKRANPIPNIYLIIISGILTILLLTDLLIHSSIFVPTIKKLIPNTPNTISTLIFLLSS